MSDAPACRNAGSQRAGASAVPPTVRTAVRGDTRGWLQRHAARGKLSRRGRSRLRARRARARLHRGLVQPEAACRHCRSGDAGPALGAHRVVWCPAGAARDAPGYAGLRRWFERFALGLDPVAAFGELAHRGAHEDRPQQPAVERVDVRDEEAARDAAPGEIVRRSILLPAGVTIAAGRTPVRRARVHRVLLAGPAGSFLPLRTRHSYRAPTSRPFAAGHTGARVFGAIHPSAQGGQVRSRAYAPC